MTIKIVDCDFDPTRRLAAFKAAGVEDLILYTKNVTPQQARAVAAAGLKMVLVFEAYGDQHHEFNAALGREHAAKAIAVARSVGAPPGAAIYFAVDTDPEGQFFAPMLAYFAAIKAYFVANSKYRDGVYGPGKVDAAVADAGSVELEWLANAKGWSGYQAFFASKRWAILQHLPTRIAGQEVDPDEALEGADIGAFTPFDPAPVGPHPVDSSPLAPLVAPADPSHDLKWVQEQMAANGFDPGPADGRWGPKTEAAVVTMMEQLLVTALPSQP
jgi:hypothetical protein